MKFFCLILSAILVLLTICIPANAQDWTTFTTEELQQILTEINTELGTREKNATYEGIDSSASIAELFPDEVLAMSVRDALGKMSIKQPVTQEELDTITALYPSGNGKLASLAGISLLRNLEKLRIEYYKPGDGWAYGSELTEIPDEICDLKNLKVLDFYGACTKITQIPERIGELSQLQELNISSTKIDHLPESIGNLTNLQKLNLAKTQIESLPECIGNLTSLEWMSIANTPISELPDSIWNLTKLDLVLTGSNVK